MAQELKPFQKHFVMQLARYLWWRSPQDCVKNPNEVLAVVMNKGKSEDVVRVLHYFDRNFLVEVLKSEDAGELDDEAWKFWNVVLEVASLGKVPPRGQKSFLQAALINFGGKSFKFNPSMNTAKMFAPTTLAERLIQITQSDQKPLFDDILRKLRAGESLEEALEVANKMLGGAPHDFEILKALCEIDRYYKDSGDLDVVTEAICAWAQKDKMINFPKQKSSASGV